jgi:hypothetical protein
MCFCKAQFGDGFAAVQTEQAGGVKFAPIGSSVGDLISYLECSAACAHAESISAGRKAEEEKNFFVWKMIPSALESIQQAWAFESEVVLASLKLFKSCLVSKILRNEGLEFEKDEGLLAKLFTALIFSKMGVMTKKCRTLRMRCSRSS